MNITFLIGNGFDVGRGLKSQYKDFYKRYTDAADLKPEEWELAGLANTIDANRPDWSYYEEQLGKYTWGFSEKPDKYQLLLDQHADFEDKFYNYLQEQVDIHFPIDKTREELRNALKAVWNTLLDNQEMNPYYRERLRGQEERSGRTIAGEMVSWVLDKAVGDDERKMRLQSLIKHVFAEQVCQTGASNAEVGQYEQQLNLDHIYGTEGFKRLEAVLNTLKKSKKTAKKVKSALERETETAKQMGSAMQEVLRELPEEWNFKKRSITCRFLCFNYSTVLDRCLQCLGDPYEYEEDGYRYTCRFHVPLHVHGKLGANGSTHCAMGVNDKSQIKACDIAGNEEMCAQLIKKEYMACVIDDETKKPVIDRGMEIIDRSDVVVVYGMSIGSTDQNWWKKIAEWLSEKQTDKSVRTLIYIHTDKKASQKKIDAETDVYRNNLIKMDPAYSTQGLIHQIKFVPGKDIFAIK